MSILHKYLPEIVYGSIDGTVTTFAIISGVAGAGLSPGIVIILGISNVLADGFSMASSNYLSTKSEAQRDNAGHGTSAAAKSAFATFTSFVIVGCVPILPYLSSALIDIGTNYEYQLSIACTAVAFLWVGIMRGRITRTSITRATVETLCIGIVAALVAYSVGAWLSHITVI